MSSAFDIHRLRPDEAESFRKAAIASWVDAYQGLLSDEAVADAPAMIDRAMAKRFDEFVVAVVDGEVAGYYSLGENNYFWHLYVDPKFQRRGVGDALHDAALAAIRARGFDTAKLDVAAANEKAVRFYRKHGWCETGRDTYDNLELIVMERSTSVGVSQ
jgi:ribosomal protein S18 acetylase RimI-like enzyme